MVIDLREMRRPLVDDIRESLATFSGKHPGTLISTVGLCGDGFHGIVSLHADTPEHSTASVRKWAKNGPAWYGEDRQGRFCNNCWDFKHCIGEFTLSGYPDLYSAPEDDPTDYITLEGAKTRAEPTDGNEGKNRIVFPFLIATLAEVSPFPMLAKAAPFRVGVQMLDSRCVDFWLVEGTASHGGTTS